MSRGYHTLIQLPYPERSRFIPQYDEEVQGHFGAFRFHRHYDNPPDPATPDSFRSFYCPACETLWLEGFEGPLSATNHPSHNTLFHEDSGQSRRSMVIYVSGACPGDGVHSKRSSAGVFFGHGSSYNLSHILLTPRPTKQTADINAAIATVRHVRNTVGPNREEAVRGREGIHFERRWRDGWITPYLDYHRNNWIFRLIIVTDSSYLVESLCKHRKGWQLEPNSSVYRDDKGTPLPNGALFGDLVNEIDLLSRDGVDVV